MICIWERGLTDNLSLWNSRLQKSLDERSSKSPSLNMRTSPLLHESPSPYGIPEKGHPALGTDPILLGPLCVLVGSASKHFMEES